MGNRGLARRPLFETRSDARYFLSRLAREVRRGSIEIHAYCILTTHFHVLVRSPWGELSAAMRRAQNAYVRHFNRTHRRDGPLVRGRYFSRRVGSLRYRRSVVRYIDANSTQARISDHPWEHELCSARDYVTRTGPPWLSREWVESAASAVAGCPWFDASAYLRTFGPAGAARDAELFEFVENRLLHPFDRMEDSFVDAAPARVRRWMRRKASIADGTEVGLALCAPRSIDRALAEACTREGPWIVVDGDRVRNGDELARVGLLRSACGASWATVVQRTGSTIARARRHMSHHDRLVRDDDAYLERATSVLRRALEAGP